MKTEVKLLRLALITSAVACALTLPPPRRSSARQGDSRSLGVINIKAEDGKELRLYERSYALVIGVSEYANGWPKLPGVKKDVEEVARALERHGFLVTKVENPDSAQLDKAFKTFIDAYGLGVENRLLFYFAGHGHTVRQSYGEEMGYIVPADAPLPDRDRAGFMSKAMDMQQMELYARRIQSKHALFLFDSCFSGAIFALSRAVPDAITYKTARPVRQFITSGSADEQVPDQSIFRRQFVESLDGEADLNKDGYVTGTELGEFLQDKVINYSRNTQHPQYGKLRNPNLDKGDFVFAVPKANPAAAVGRRDEPPPATRPAATPTPAAVTSHAGSDASSGALAGRDLKAVYFLDAKVGWAGGVVLFTTEDGGHIWERVRSLSNDIVEDIQFTGRRSGFILTEGELFRTRDGGMSWRSVFPPKPQQRTWKVPALSGMSCLGERVWLIGPPAAAGGVQDGRLYNTDDGGESWSEISVPSRAGLIDIDFANGEQGVIVGRGGTLLRTSDGGRTWRALQAGTHVTLHHVDFNSDHRGVAVGESGTVLLTTDGWKTWRVLKAPTDAALLNVRLEGDKAWAVGERGVILRSEDGGETWTRQESGTSQSLTGLFVGAGVCWAAGADGTLIYCNP